MAPATGPRGRQIWRHVLAMCAAAIAGLIAAPVDTQIKAPDLSAKALLQRAQKYVTTYEQQFAYLVADETYVQATGARNGTPTETRTIHGELFLTYLPADMHWMSVHDFADVDGTPVTDRENLETLLRSSPLGPIAQRLAARNARYNIGGFVRTFNEPTLALMPFEADRASTFRFSRGAIDRHDPAATLVTLRFREADEPTIIRSAVGDRPVYSSGEIVLEAETGRIRHTTIGVSGRITATLETTFAPSENVGMWVPVRFTERYTVGSRGQEEVTTCDSTYTNYRRFDVAVRIR
jgi:hypothetical protein